jgi:hypothetical protein
MSSPFYIGLTNYIKAQDESNANKLVMLELGRLLATNKKDFIEVLRSANISIPDNATDIQLVNAFVDNAPNNRRLLLGASFMIGHNNKSLNAEGGSFLSDTGVKATYKLMFDYFDAYAYQDTSDEVNDDYYNATGEEYLNVVGGLVAGALKEGVGLSSKIVEGQQKRKFGASDTLAKQQEARQQMIQSIMAQRQAQQEQLAKDKEAKAKQQKTLIVVGASLLGLVIVGAVVYSVMKSRKNK